MKSYAATVLLLVPAMIACVDTGRDGSDQCTLKAIGNQTGASSLKATLYVPEQYLTGAEISDGGIMIVQNDCDFPLNAFISDETANYIIDNAPRDTLTDNEHTFSLVDAELFIWKFSDGSEKPRFFVMRVHEMAPIRGPRTAHEAEYYSMPDAVDRPTTSASPRAIPIPTSPRP